MAANIQKYHYPEFIASIDKKKFYANLEEAIRELTTEKYCEYVVLSLVSGTLGIHAGEHLAKLLGEQLSLNDEFYYEEVDKIISRLTDDFNELYREFKKENGGKYEFETVYGKKFKVNLDDFFISVGYNDADGGIDVFLVK